MLKCETNTNEIENEILEQAKEELKPCKIATMFEDDQWYVGCINCGAAWSVNDAQKDGKNYFSFEQIDAGDEYCLDNL